MATTEHTANGTGPDSEHFDSIEGEAKRIHRALANLFCVEEGGNPGEYRVHSESGNTYTVDLLEGACACPDAERSAMCKHLFRVIAETGATPLDAGKATVTVTLVPSAFAELASAVKVLKDAEVIVEAFDATGEERRGALTEQQCADAVGALETATKMGGKMGADDQDAARDAIKALQAATDE